MKINKRYNLLLCIFSGILSVGYTATANAKFIAKCRTLNQPGLYTLRTNLSSTGNCLIVNANHVTIDLNGYVISHTGNKTSESIGISGTITQGLHVHNGTITGYDIGINGSKFSRLNALNLTNNLFEGARLGDGSRVTNCIFAFNGKGSAPALTSGKGTTIKDSTFYQNGSHINVGKGSLILNNVGRHGNEDGFDMAGQTLVIGNNLINTTDEGLRTFGLNNNVINNNARGNTGDFIYLEGLTNSIGNAADTAADGFGGECFSPPCRDKFFNLWSQ